MTGINNPKKNTKRLGPDMHKTTTVLAAAAIGAAATAIGIAPAAADPSNNCHPAAR